MTRALRYPSPPKVTSLWAELTRLGDHFWNAGQRDLANDYYTRAERFNPENSNRAKAHLGARAI